MKVTKVSSGQQLVKTQVSSCVHMALGKQVEDVQILPAHWTQANTASAHA